MKYNQKLPKKVEQKLDNYIERIKKIQWFKPEQNLDKGKIEKQVNFVLECFGIKAGIEYKQLKTSNDWDAARDAARDAAWDAARDAAWDAAWDAARGAAWGAARGAARGAAWGAENILVEDLDTFKKKYPNGTFLNLIPLWEMGLYPVGVVNGNFIIYIPPTKLSFPNIK